jgi:hypothetical protein
VLDKLVADKAIKDDGKAMINQALTEFKAIFKSSKEA